MESPAELNQQMIFAIRAVLKPARDTRVSLNAFLNFCTPHLLRAPEEYIAGKYVVCDVRYIGYIELHEVTLHHFTLNRIIILTSMFIYYTIRYLIF
jgi:hypothetical protein